MANSTTNIDTISQSQSGKEVTANAFFDAASPATVYGRRASACSGLTWGYYGGAPTLSGGSLGSISNGTLSLAPSATNYIVAAKATGAVTVSTSNTNWNNTTDYWRLYSIVVGASTITSYTDSRELGKMTGGGGTGAAITVKDEGSNLTTALASIDFVGGGVTATTSGNNVTVTIGGSASITAKDEGSNLTTSMSSINFAGAGVTATNSGADVTVTIPGGGSGSGREVLVAARTYYVRADGSDSNDGLANTSGGAFLTIQKAIDVICSTLDVQAGVTATVQVADGAYTGANVMKQFIGAGSMVIQGNSGTPANVVISVTSNHCFYNPVGGTVVTVKDMKLTTTTSGTGLFAANGGEINFTNIDFGVCATYHRYANATGRVTATGNYSISGGAVAHEGAATGGLQYTASRTITISGTPAFSTAFALVQTSASIINFSSTFSGSATGKRYDAYLNGAINTLSGGASYFPGDSAGTTATGGQYA